MRSGRIASTVVALAVTGCALAGCGSSDQTAAAAPAAGQGNGQRGGFGGIDPALRQKIDQCLQAAGIATPSRAPRPSGEPRPSGQPRPTDQPRPSGAPRGGGGFVTDPKAQAALQACGITLPTRGPRPSGAPAAPATPAAS